MNGRRVARVWISLEILEQLLAGNLLGPVISSAPADLRVLGVGQTFEDQRMHRATILCESKTFAALPEGAEPPIFTPLFTHRPELEQ